MWRSQTRRWAVGGVALRSTAGLLFLPLCCSRCWFRLFAGALRTLRAIRGDGRSAREGKNETRRAPSTRGAPASTLMSQGSLRRVAHFDSRAEMKKISFFLMILSSIVAPSLSLSFSQTARSLLAFSPSAPFASGPPRTEQVHRKQLRSQVQRDRKREQHRRGRDSLLLS